MATSDPISEIIGDYRAFVELRVGASSGDIRSTLSLAMTGERREVGFNRSFYPDIDIA